MCEVHNWIIYIAYIGEVCKQNHQQQLHKTVLALATLGCPTKNRNDPISPAVSLKVAKARTMVTVA